jgi:N-methylhydantoinase A/oxoprolinase/acetone carboxylase beta subunit
VARGTDAAARRRRSATIAPVIVGVDMGGTFTDVVAYDASGEVRTAKAATTADGVGGVLAALRQVVEPADVESLVFGSTVATNALAQRRLATVGLLATAGFRDLLDIRRLWRPRLFGHDWDRPPALVPRALRLEARGRLAYDGSELEPLSEDDVRAAAATFRDAGVEAVAVAFLHAYASDAHERRAGELLAAALPGVRILLSSDVNPERKEYERTSTTVIAAGLAPVIDRALGTIEERLREAGLPRAFRVMKSNGGVMGVAAARRRPVELVKSGPAGGVSAGLHLARALDEPNLILLDIGGTTADVSVLADGHATRADHDSVEWDIPIRVPVVEIRSIGAGGGSLIGLDAAGTLHVGPRSAGAEPGPAAYGRGGTEPTVTDAALVAGWLDPDRFLGGAMPLDGDAAARALQPIADGLGRPLRDTAAAALQVATAEMATLVRELTVERGHDPRRFALVAFGGAGPLFLGPLLDELELPRGFVPGGAGTLSAAGGAVADVVVDEVRTESDPARIAAGLAALAERARAAIAAEGLSDPELHTAVDVRYAGQWAEIEIPLDPREPFATAVARFEAEHERRFGHRRPESDVELVALRARAVGATPKPARRQVPERPPAAPRAHRTVELYGAGTVELPVYDRDGLGAGTALRGPLIVEEPDTTLVLTPGQAVHVTTSGVLEVRRG